MMPMNLENDVNKQDRTEAQDLNLATEASTSSNTNYKQWTGRGPVQPNLRVKSSKGP